MRLKKELNLLDVICLASGAMISSGLFILPGLAHAAAGPAAIVSYVLAGLLAITGMLSIAELTSAMPEAGGAYFYVSRSMGPAVGAIYGMVNWVSLSLKSVFALVGLATFTVLFTRLDIRLIAVTLCLIFIASNIVGIKNASRLQNALVFGLVGALIIYIVSGLPSVDASHFENFAASGVAAILSTAGFVFVSYGGLLEIAGVAEEVKDSRKTMPLGMTLSLGIVILLYALTIFVTMGVLDGQELDNSITPVSDGARAFMGENGTILMGIAAILAFITTANAGVMAASRYPLALSRSGILPGFFKKINSRFGTPHASIIFTGGIMIAALFLKLDTIIRAASSVVILTYILPCIAVIMLRKIRPEEYRPRFRSPLYPWTQIIGTIGFFMLLFQMGTEAIAGSFLFVLAALLVYWLYGRKNLVGKNTQVVAPLRMAKKEK